MCGLPATLTQVYLLWLRRLLSGYYIIREPMRYGSPWLGRLTRLYPQGQADISIIILFIIMGASKIRSTRYRNLSSSKMYLHSRGIFSNI